MAAAGVAPAPSPDSSHDCPKDKTIIVECFVILAVFAMLLLNVMGSLRRQSSSSLLHAIVTGVYTLSYPLVGYTLGWMNSSAWYYNDFAVWAVFLLLLLGNTDSLTVCRLSDIDAWKSIYVQHLFKVIVLVWIVLDICQVEAGAHKITYPYLYPVYAILLVVVLKGYVRIASMRMVSKSYLGKKVKVIVEYMQHVDNPLVSCDPETMEGCSYMVAGEEYCIDRPGHTPWYNDDGLRLKITTVEKIWQCTGNLLEGAKCRLIKDLCLSMALSKMLNRRFAGFKLSEAELGKAHHFVFEGLLVGEEPHQRAFRVIEEELVFVHDLYYTRYCYLYQKGRYLALCLPVIMFALCLWLTYLLAVKHKQGSRGDTILITVVVAFLEAYQLYLYMASGWFKVALILNYISTPFLQRRCCCFLEKILGFLLRLKAFRPWKGTLGQYCLLQELGRQGRLKKCLHCATLRLVDRSRKKGRKKSVKLSQDVKKAIVDSLLGSNNGHLTNGVRSLRNNGVDGELSWACDATAIEGGVTRTILLWHIATTLCEHQPDARAKEEDTVLVVRIRTASTLSQYCMHLLAFAPDLLPDHSSISESILDQTIHEAGKLLKGVKKVESRCEKLMEITSTDDRLLVQSVRLARDLIQHIQDPALRWKVLSDFWAEMMLYVAPSDDARAHLELLARGGQFITHLWALLTHAGVLERGHTGAANV